MSDRILMMSKIDKSFPSVKALEGVDLEVKKNEIHGLIGENGAGKSTLMKILSGLYTHDAGTIEFCGKAYEMLTPRLVEKIGISVIHQERHVVPFLTVAESLFLGIEGDFIMKRKKLEKRAEELIFGNLGVEIKGNSLMSDLSVGEQQLVQICRALMTNPKLIIFDEPTAVLPRKEAEKLFEIIRELKKTVSVIYISHYFGEILDLCDIITVLKNGKKVTTISAKNETIENLVFLMSGKEVKKQYPDKNRVHGDCVLQIENLSHQEAFENVSFNIRQGEILGLTGLMGSGHAEVGESLYGAQGIISGNIIFNGVQQKTYSREQAVRMGIGYVPEDRRGKGVIQLDSVRENITLASLEKISKRSVINKKTELADVKMHIENLSIKTPSEEQMSGLLSGGNQQKVVIARWIQGDSKLLILNQPTSGVDIGARAEIYAFIHQMAKNGSAVLLISQDIQELVGMSDKILTMFRGQVNGSFNTGDYTSNEQAVDEIIISMMGVKKE